MRIGVLSRLIVTAAFLAGLSGCHLFAGAPCSTQNECSLTERCVDGFSAFLRDEDWEPAIRDAGASSGIVDAGKSADGGEASDGVHKDAADNPGSTHGDGWSGYYGGLSNVVTW